MSIYNFIPEIAPYVHALCIRIFLEALLKLCPAAKQVIESRKWHIFSFFQLHAPLQNVTRNTEGATSRISARRFIIIIFKAGRLY